MYERFHALMQLALSGSGNKSKYCMQARKSTQSKFYSSVSASMGFTGATGTVLRDERPCISEQAQGHMFTHGRLLGVLH